MKSNHVLLGSIVFLLSACANETPLIFVSKTSVGLDVSSPTTGTTDIGISFGWKSVDAAYIPVVEITETGEVLNQVKSGESISPEQRAQVASLLTSELQKATADLQAKEQALANADAAAVATEQKKVEAQRELVATLSESLMRALDRSDALSIFSVVDTNSQIRTENTGVGVGKVYATGMAAQNVSRNFKAHRRSCEEVISEAVTKLANSSVAADQDKAKSLIAACRG